MQAAFQGIVGYSKNVSQDIEIFQPAFLILFDQESTQLEPFDFL